MTNRDYKVTIEKTYLTDNYKETEVKHFENKKRAIAYAEKIDSYYNRLNDAAPIENAFYYTITIEEIKLIKVVCK